MTTTFLLVGLVLAMTQNRSATPACVALTPQEVSSLIGAAKAMPISNGPTGSACLLQEREKTVSVIIVNAASPDSATRQWILKKAIASGREVSGWGVQAYTAVQGTAAVVGVVKGNTFMEVKANDPAQKPHQLGPKLHAAMKSAAGRL